MNFAPLFGWVSVTVGGLFAGGAAVTVIVVGGVVVDASSLSIALAVSAYVPASHASPVEREPIAAVVLADLRSVAVELDHPHVAVGVSRRRREVHGGRRGEGAPLAGASSVIDGGSFGGGGGGGGGGGASEPIWIIFATEGTPASSMMNSM